MYIGTKFISNYSLIIIFVYIYDKIKFIYACVDRYNILMSYFPHFNVWDIFLVLRQTTIHYIVT